MNRFLAVSVLAGCLAFFHLAPGSGPMRRAEAAPNPGAVGKHALLVGCTEYPNLDKKFWLNGPGNDVQLMAKALREMFGFPPESIVILSDEVAKTKKDKSLEPTRANIKREFEKLAKAKEGDKVVIMMGGHGSQMPQGENPPNPKPDGMSEIFLPKDVGKWDDNAGSVENAIVDFEFAAWLKAIQDTKATIWITIDACHSGTITRDVGKEKSREIDKEAGLGIPKQRVKEAEERAIKRDGPTRGGPVDKENTFAKLTKGKTGGLVAIYAAKPTEVTLERDMPMKSKDAKPYGLLTYTLVQTLQEANAKPDSKTLTYRELVQRIQSQYFAWGRTFPTPLIEGVDSDREVLGEKEWPGRSSIVLAVGNNGLKVTSGALCGLTRDSILAVHSPPGQPDKVLGHVRVTEVHTIDSDVEPCEFDKIPPFDAKKPPLGGACKVVFVDYGDQQLKLALEPKWKDGATEKVMEKQDQERILNTLGKLNDPKRPSLVKLVTDPSEADWVLRPYKDGKMLVMVPAADLLVAKVEKPRQFGPYPDSEELIEKLEESAALVARYENLKKLAGGFTDDSGDQGVKFKVDIRRGKDKQDKKGTFPMTWPSTDLSFYNDDRVVFTITNTSRAPIDLTILHLDSDYKISCHYPKNKEYNRIEPGKSLTLKPADLSTEQTAIEHLVFIAVKGENQTVDFTSLEQPGLDKARATANSKAMQSPLGQLFEKAMYNAGSTRGMKTAEVDDHAMHLVTWEIKHDKRPREKK
jgi:Caspase domain